MSLAENVDKIHEQLIQEEGIAVKDLPVNLKKKIKGWDLLFAKLKKNPEDEQLFRSVQRKSIELADKIQDFIELDYQEEEKESKEPDANKEPKEKADKTEEPDAKKEPKEKADKTEEPDAKKEPKEKAEEPAKQTTKVTTKKSSFGNLVMQKKILTQIEQNKNGRIRIGQLKSIIGKEPDYPEQKVHTITLRKVFMSSEYRLK